MVAATALALIGSGRAFADCGDHSDFASGYEVTTVGGAGGQQTILWDHGDREVRLSVQPGAMDSGAKCQDSQFDWGTGGPHYDSRLVRNCLDHSFLRMFNASDDQGGCGCSNGAVTEPSGWGGRTVSGISKGQGALWDTADADWINQDYLTEGNSNCNFDPHQAVHSADFMRYWKMRSDGSLDFNSGGVVTQFDN